MLKKVAKITLITILVLLLVRIIFINNVRIDGRCSIYIDEYKEFYLYKEDYKTLISFDFGEGGGASGYKVWFLLGQKRKLLEKMKKDINSELTDIIGDNSDILKGYKISDDFINVYIYYYKNAENRDLNPEATKRFDELAYKLNERTIALKVELYHQFIRGYVRTEFYENIMKFVEVE